MARSSTCGSFLLQLLLGLAAAVRISEEDHVLSLQPPLVDVTRIVSERDERQCCCDIGRFFTVPPRTGRCAIVKTKSCDSVKVDWSGDRQLRFYRNGNPKHCKVPEDEADAVYKMEGYCRGTLGLVRTTRVGHTQGVTCPGVGIIAKDPTVRCTAKGFQPPAQCIKDPGFCGSATWETISKKPGFIPGLAMIGQAALGDVREVECNAGFVATVPKVECRRNKSFAPRAECWKATLFDIFVSDYVLFKIPGTTANFHHTGFVACPAEAQVQASTPGSSGEIKTRLKAGRCSEAVFVRDLQRQVGAGFNRKPGNWEGSQETFLWKVGTVPSKGADTARDFLWPLLVKAVHWYGFRPGTYRLTSRNGNSMTIALLRYIDIDAAKALGCGPKADPGRQCAAPENARVAPDTHASVERASRVLDFTPLMKHDNVDHVDMDDRVE